MSRRKWTWTEHQKKRAEAVKSVVDELCDYWPLTLRQIYYRLVANGSLKNTRSEYTMLSTLVKWMRIDDLLPWHALEDRTRSISEKRGFESTEIFIEQEAENFLAGYSRCLVQGQAKYVEVWAEKDALSRIFAEAVWPYCVRSVVCRGYSSVSFIAEFYQRAERAIMKGQDPVVLYFGDLDPSGVQMLEASIETLEKELGLVGVAFKRAGLLPSHIKQYSLPSDPEAAKVKDPRYKNYVEKYGTVAVELDALHPTDLTRMIRLAIEAELDMSDVLEQKRQEKLDRATVEDLRSKVMQSVNAFLGRGF